MVTGRRPQLRRSRTLRESTNSARSGLSSIAAKRNPGCCRVGTSRAHQVSEAAMMLNSRVCRRNIWLGALSSHLRRSQGSPKTAATSSSAILMLWNHQRRWMVRSARSSSRTSTGPIAANPFTNTLWVMSRSPRMIRKRQRRPLLAYLRTILTTTIIASRNVNHLRTSSAEQLLATTSRPVGPTLRTTTMMMTLTISWRSETRENCNDWKRPCLL